MLLVILVPSFLLFDGLMHSGAAGWLTVAWVLVLGLLATLPLGMIIGSLVPGVQKVGTWGMLPSWSWRESPGSSSRSQALWGWVQVVAQVFPMYWLGLGMRSAFLPDAAARSRSAAPGAPADRARPERVGGRRRAVTPLSCAGWPAASPGSQVAAAGRPRCMGREPDGATPSTTASPCCAPSRACRRRELADALGVHYQTVGYLERGEYNPSLHLALRIAEFFGLPVEAIFSTTPFPRVSDMTGPSRGSRRRPEAGGTTFPPGSRRELASGGGARVLDSDVGAVRGRAVRQRRGERRRPPVGGHAMPTV